MDSKNIFKSFVVANMLIAAQVNASNIEIEGKDEQRKMIQSHVPLNPETKEIMRDMLSLNEVYESAQASKKIAPNSDVIKIIERNTTEYIEDLKKILPQVTVSENNATRQELVDSVHRKNNPFDGFYY